MFVARNPAPTIVTPRNPRRASSLYFTLATYSTLGVLAAVLVALVGVSAVVAYAATAQSWGMTTMFAGGVTALLLLSWTSYRQHSALVLQRGVRLPLQPRLEEDTATFLLTNKAWKRSTTAVFREVYGKRLWSNMELNSGAVLAVNVLHDNTTLSTYSTATTDIIEGHLSIAGQIFDTRND